MQVSRFPAINNFQCTTETGFMVSRSGLHDSMGAKDCQQAGTYIARLFNGCCEIFLSRATRLLLRSVGLSTLPTLLASGRVSLAIPLRGRPAAEMVEHHLT